MTSPARRRDGFSLMELLLVIVLIGMATAVAIPSFTGTFRGARLRSAARTVAMAARFARSSAVLHQQDMALIFYPGRNEFELVSIRDSAAASDRERFLDSREARAVAGLLGEEPAASDPAAALPAIESELVRPLPEGVGILEVAVNGEVIDIEGSYLANFYANGMSDEFAVRLVDESGRGAEIAMDPLSGQVAVSYSVD